MNLEQGLRFAFTRREKNSTQKVRIVREKNKNKLGLPINGTAFGKRNNTHDSVKMRSIDFWLDGLGPHSQRITAGLFIVTHRARFTNVQKPVKCHKRL